MPKKIVDNYLFLTDIHEFNQSVLDTFFYRLSLFLNVYIDKPELRLRKFTKNSRAWFEHWSNRVVFITEKYRVESPVFSFDKDEIEGMTLTDIDDYKYIIMVSDIYHELIHGYQYVCTGWKHSHLLEMSDVFIEGTNDFFTAMLTGQVNIDYERETTAIWYFLRHMLKIKRPDILYNAARDLLIEPSFFDYNNYNEYGIKEYVNKNYDGDVVKLIKEINGLNKVKQLNECIKDIDRVHKLIFYRW